VNTFQDYLDAPGLNFSTLKHIEKSPKHYLAALTTSRTTKAMQLGQAVDALTLSDLDRDAVLESFGVVVYPEARRGNKWKLFQAANEGQIIVTEPEIATALAMRNAIHDDPVASALLDGAGFQVPLYWRAHGVALKGRVDALTPTALIDLKTTRHIGPRAFASDAAKMLYHAQLGLYASGVEAITGQWPTAHIVAVENIPPFDVVVYDLDEDDLVRGLRRVEGWIARWKEASASDYWPGVGDGKRQRLVLPDWAASSGEDVILPEDPGATDEDD
jgi:hypothetical protein